MTRHFVIFELFLELQPRNLDHCLHVSELRWAFHGVWMCCAGWRPRRVHYRVLPVAPPTEEPLTTRELFEAYTALEALEKRAAVPPAGMNVEALEFALARAQKAHVASDKLQPARSKLATALAVQGLTPTAAQARLLHPPPDELPV